MQDNARVEGCNCNKVLEKFNDLNEMNEKMLYEIEMLKSEIDYLNRSLMGDNYDKYDSEIDVRERLL